MNRWLIKFNLTDVSCLKFKYDPARMLRIKFIQYLLLNAAMIGPLTDIGWCSNERFNLKNPLYNMFFNLYYFVGPQLRCDGTSRLF